MSDNLFALESYLDIYEINDGKAVQINLANEILQSSYIEGNMVIRQYEIPRRNTKLRQACIDAKGTLCQICTIDYETMYGSLWKDFVHIHHIEFLSSQRGVRNVTVDDLIPVCPNCHAMLHRKTIDGRYLTPDELRETIARHTVILRNLGK